MNYILLNTLKIRAPRVLFSICKIKKYNSKEKLLALIFILFSNDTFAHVRWFVTEPGTFYNSYFSWDIYSFVILLGAALFLAMCGFADTQCTNNSTLKTILYKPIYSGDLVYPLIKLTCGIYLLSNLIQGHFIAPNFSGPEQTQIEMLVQATLLIILIINQNLFSSVFFITAISLIFFYPFKCVIDYTPELAAIGAALWFSNTKNNHKQFRITLADKLLVMSGQDVALHVLRFGLGLQLIILTIHDKLMHPGFALFFLHEHPNFNFMQLLGFTQFTDVHFVLSAGFAELCFGLLLVTNLASRLGFALIIFFFTLTGIVLGPTELMGHVPILLVALLLFLIPSQKMLFFNASSRVLINSDN